MNVCLRRRERRESEWTSLLKYNPPDPGIACAIWSAEIIVRLHCRGQRIPRRLLVTQSSEARGHVPKYLLPIKTQIAGLKQIRPIRGLRIVARLSLLSNEPCAYLHMAAMAAGRSSRHPSIRRYPRGGYESVPIWFIARTYQLLDRS